METYEQNTQRRHKRPSATKSPDTPEAGKGGRWECAAEGAYRPTKTAPYIAHAQRVIPDLDVYRSANLLVEQQVDEATIHAAMIADAMLEIGDLDSRARG